MSKKYDKKGHIIYDEEPATESQNEEFAVWHIILTDLSSKESIIKKILRKKGFTMTIKPSDNTHMKGLYWQYETNASGVYCYLILAKDNKLHCLCNDYLCGHRCLIDFVFENSYTFDGLPRDFSIEAQWDYDAVIKNAFYSFLNNEIGRIAE
jgi:hypothetical protein